MDDYEDANDQHYFSQDTFGEGRAITFYVNDGHIYIHGLHRGHKESPHTSYRIVPLEDGLRVLVCDEEGNDHHIIDVTLVNAVTINIKINEDKLSSTLCSCGDHHTYLEKPDGTWTLLP